MTGVELFRYLPLLICIAGAPTRLAGRVAMPPWCCRPAAA
ncbi:protein of unknown function [Burkholderia multivorans]